MEYKIENVTGTWMVFEGYISYGDFVKGDILFSSKSIADCYAWVKIKQENLLI